ILAVGMVVLAISLAAFPWVTTAGQAVGYAIGLGITGGIVTVIFFAVYGHAFGRSHLGAIQAVVQVISVFASALGPLLLATLKARTGSYDTLFPVCAVLASVLALCCWVVKLPRRPIGA